MQTPPYVPVADRFDFRCRYCGKGFGGDVVGLARHIGRRHDPVRSG